MIVPVTTEPEWIGALEGLPPFQIGSQEIVLISPHPDDETLGAGALLAAHCRNGGRATVVAVTDGEAAYDDFAGLGAIRVREHEEAVACLGEVRMMRLGLKDSGLADQQEQLEKALRAIVTPSCHVIAPWTGDFHPDHEVCGRAAISVAAEAGARLSWYFFWTWHRGTPGTLAGLELQRFVFGEDLLELKLRALACHRSQLDYSAGEPILPERLLGPAHRNFEVFADA